MTTRRMCLIALALAVVVVGPAMAEKGDQKVRFGVQMLNPMGDYTESDGFETFELEADSAIGPFVEYERMVSDKAGIFANISLQNHDIDAEVSEISPGGFSESATIGDVDVMPIEVGANFYVVQNDSLELFLGPKIAYVMFSDVELDPAFVVIPDPTKIPTEDTFAFGVNFGLDVPLGGGAWVFSTGLQYLKFSLETDEGVDSVDVDIDPFVIRAGVGRRF